MKPTKLKPRKKDGRVTFDLVVRDGNNRIIDIKEHKLSALEEVLETMKRKL